MFREICDSPKMQKDSLAVTWKCMIIHFLYCEWLLEQGGLCTVVAMNTLL